MAFLRFTRDPRGYEHFYLVESSTNRRGKSRSRVLYFFRTPPNVKVGREPFDESVRRALEARYPDVEFDWRRILETPIPSADAEKWRERRRQEKAEKAARRAARAEEGDEREVPEDAVAEEVSPEPPVSDTIPVSDTLAAPDALAVSDTEDAEDDAEDRPPHAIEAAVERGAAPEVAEGVAVRRRRRRRRRGRPPGTQTRSDPGTQPGSQAGSDPGTHTGSDPGNAADEPEGD